MRYVCDAIDGDGGAATDEDRYARRRYHASRTLDNMLAVDGSYDPESAEIHETAINAETRTRPPRTTTRGPCSQRNADALTNLLRESLDRGADRQHPRRYGPTSPSRRPRRPARRHPGPDRRDPHRTPTHRRLSAATLERIMCDCDLTRDPHARPLRSPRRRPRHPHRLPRTLESARRPRPALPSPRLHQPPERCEAHHIIALGPRRTHQTSKTCACSATPPPPTPSRQASETVTSRRSSPAIEDAGVTN